MHWHKKGVIFEADGQHGWIHSHAQIPTPILLEDRIRIYYATRPTPDLSMTSFIDVETDNPSQIIHIHDEPILQTGQPGYFDEHGIMPNCAIHKDGKIWLYYVGWSRRCSVPYSNWTGLAISKDGIHFERMFNGPVFDRTTDEIFCANGVFVTKEKKSGQYHAWYASGTGWAAVEGKQEEQYVIKHATSSNAITWTRDNKEILPRHYQHEATTRPSVIFYNNKYHMWFCHRGLTDFRNGENSYRIGYACSDNMENWNRDDSQSGMELSATGWDSKMQAYPYVLKTPEKVFMFYNGNGFGQSGMGYAELVMD